MKTFFSMQRRAVYFLFVIFYVCAPGFSADTLKIACVGNSITEGIGLPSPATQNYVALVQKMLSKTYLTGAIKPFAVAPVAGNFGVTMRTLLKNASPSYWSEQKFKDVFAFKPDVVTIMLGTNDTKPVYATLMPQFEGDYTALIDTFAHLTTRPIVIPCLPATIFPNNMTINDNIMRTQIVPAIQRVARNKKLETIDVRTPTLTIQNYFPDGVHPDSNGAKVLADIMYEGIVNYGTTQNPRIRMLWYGTAPAAVNTDTTSKPLLYVYPAPDSLLNGSAVIICPGGSYTKVSLDLEGFQEAKWFNQHGVTAFVLRYRCSPYLHPVPWNDAKRAMRLVRYYAPYYKIDTTRIGIMGFSAGGHLASTLGTHYDFGNAADLDPLERLKCRPDFLLLVYPVITLQGPYAHTGSRNALLGTNPSSALVDSLCNQNHVTPQTPKTFLASGDSDHAVPIQNSMMFDSACKANGVPDTLFVDHGKDHGYGMNGLWPDACLAWMKTQGLLPPPARISHPSTAALRKPTTLFPVVSMSRHKIRIDFSAAGFTPNRVEIIATNGTRVAVYSLPPRGELIWKAPAAGTYIIYAHNGTNVVVRRIGCW